MKTKKKQAIILLASGKCVLETAKQVGVNRNTITNWLKIPEFSEAVQIAKQEWLDECRNELRVIAKDALKTLYYAVQAGARPHGPQIKAIELALKATGVIQDYKPDIDNSTEIEMVFPGPSKTPESST